jgi:hypothetical protein
LGELVKICICYIQELNEIGGSENYTNTFGRNQNLEANFLYSGQQKTQLSRLESSLNTTFNKIENKKLSLKNAPHKSVNHDINKKMTILTSRKYLEKYKRNDFLYRHGNNTNLNLKIKKAKKNICYNEHSSIEFNEYFSKLISIFRQNLWTLINNNQSILKRARLCISTVLVVTSIVFLLFNIYSN